MSRAPRNTQVEFLRLPHLPGVELRYSCYRERVFRTHTHPVWSVGLIESGSTTFTLAGRTHRAGAGQLVVIGPGRAHACNPTDGDSITYLMFYLSREWLAPRDPGRGFPTFADPVIDDPEVFARFADVYRALTADPRTRDGSMLKAAISSLVTAHARPDTRPVSESDLESVGRAKRLLASRLDERVTLQQLAQETNVSRSHLSRIFAAAEGLPPHTYHNQLRIERAKQLLASGAPLADAGTASGFNDQSHFTRVFREFTGATPSQYQTAFPSPK